MTQSERVQHIKEQMTEARQLDRESGGALAARDHRENALLYLARFVAGDMTQAMTYTAKRMAKEILK